MNKYLNIYICYLLSVTHQVLRPPGASQQAQLGKETKKTPLRGGKQTRNEKQAQPTKRHVVWVKAGNRVAANLES